MSADGKAVKHELNYPAAIVTIIEAWRASPEGHRFSIERLLNYIEADAHKAGMQLQAINEGKTLSSIQINEMYAGGYRFTGAGTVRKT